MNAERLIKDLTEGIEYIGGLIYENFLKSFECSANDFNEVTKFESAIPALFLFDYMVSAQDVPQKFRQQFYEISSADIVKRFTNKVANDNLALLIDYRYGEYAELPATAGDGWQKSLHTLLEITLNGTKGVKAVKKTYPLNLGGDIQTMPFKLQFIEGEIANSYRTAKIVDELFKGATISEAIKTIEKLETNVQGKAQPVIEKKTAPATPNAQSDYNIKLCHDILPLVVIQNKKSFLNDFAPRFEAMWPMLLKRLSQDFYNGKTKIIHQINRYKRQNGTIISVDFGEQDTSLACHYVFFVLRQKRGLFFGQKNIDVEYFTVEKTFGDDGYTLCSWASKDNHQNYGKCLDLSASYLVHRVEELSSII